MAAVTRMIYRTLSNSWSGADFSKQVAMFAAAGLFVFLLSLTNGLDMSPGFF